MRLFSIAEINQMSQGSPIESVRGKIIKVDKRFAGTNTFGEWSLQKIVISDGQFQIPVQLNGMPEVPQHFNGLDILVSSTPSDRGPFGVTAIDDRGKGQAGPPVRTVKAADKAMILNVASGQPLFAPTGQLPPTQVPLPTAFPPAPPAALPPAALPPYQAPPPATTFTPTPAPQPVTEADLGPFMTKHARLYGAALQATCEMLRGLENLEGFGTFGADCVQDCASRIYYAAKDRGFLDVV